MDRVRGHRGGAAPEMRGGDQSRPARAASRSQPPISSRLGVAISSRSGQPEVRPVRGSCGVETFRPRGVVVTP